MTERHSDHEPLATLRGLRPDPDSSTEWDTATSTAVLDRILAAPRVADVTLVRPARRRPVRRGRLAAAGIVAGGVAAAAVVGLVAPSGSPGGPDPAVAAELRRLAVVAGEQGPSAGPRQYAYTALIEEQTAEDLSEPPAPGETRVGTVDRRPRLDTWLAPSGLRYVEVGTARCLARSTYTGSDAEQGVYDNLTGAQLAALPTEPGRLAAYFDAHPSGDNRGTTNRFLSAGDLVRSGLASPPLRAAALQVLARTDGLTVRTDTTDDRGRTATAVEHPEDQGVQTLFFDPTTSVVLEERQTADGGDAHYSGIFLVNRVVDRLPDLPRCPPDTDDPTGGPTAGHGG